MRDQLKDNQVNLCSSCCNAYPDCPESNKVLFGDGIGNDNICACNKYEAIRNRHPVLDNGKL